MSYLKLIILRFFYSFSGTKTDTKYYYTVKLANITCSNSFSSVSVQQLFSTFLLRFISLKVQQKIRHIELYYNVIFYYIYLTFFEIIINLYIIIYIKSNCSVPIWSTHPPNVEVTQLIIQ
jgi:hypothetical protein